MTSMLYNEQGRRKYLTKEERLTFLKTSSEFSEQIHTLCWVLSATGCRISEAVSLTTRSIDQGSKMIVIESLKKRCRGIYRGVPIEDTLLKALRDMHALDEDMNQPILRLWPWSRITAYRHVHSVMNRAGLSGPHAMPKGLRHGFGVTAIQSGVPLNMVQRWLGHADMRTTAIYTAAMGPEERSIAARMWKAGAFTPPSQRPRIMPSLRDDVTKSDKNQGYKRIACAM